MAYLKIYISATQLWHGLNVVSLILVSNIQRKLNIGETFIHWHNRVFLEVDHGTIYIWEPESIIFFIRCYTKKNVCHMFHNKFVSPNPLEKNHCLLPDNDWPTFEWRVTIMELSCFSPKYMPGLLFSKDPNSNVLG